MTTDLSTGPAQLPAKRRQRTRKRHTTLRKPLQTSSPTPSARSSMCRPEHFYFDGNGGLPAFSTSTRCRSRGRWLGERPATFTLGPLARMAHSLFRLSIAKDVTSLLPHNLLCASDRRAPSYGRNLCGAAEMGSSAGDRPRTLHCSDSPGRVNLAKRRRISAMKAASQGGSPSLLARARWLHASPFGAKRCPPHRLS